MNGKVLKKVLSMILALAVMITTAYSTGGPLFAAELPGMETEAVPDTESASDTVPVSDIESVSGTEAMPDTDTGLTPDTESLDGTEAASDTESLDGTEAVFDTESLDGTEAVPGTEFSSESIDSEIPNGDDAEGTQETEILEEGESAIGDWLLGKDTVPPDHSLSTVYWNSNPENMTSGTGHVLQYGGNDNNSGSSAKAPVQTLETALLRAAANATVYCMEYYGYNRTSAAVDGGYYSVTVKRYPGYTGNILQVAEGTLRLDNITLDGSDSHEDRVLTVGNGATLEIGDSVGNDGDSIYFFEGGANPAVLAGVPEEGTVYPVQFSTGYFERTPVETEEGKEILLIDASSCGLNPENFFSVRNLPDGWGIYLKDDTQLWARKTSDTGDGTDDEYKNVWLDGVNGSDSNNGSAIDKPVRTWRKAFEIYQTKPEDSIILITGTVTVWDALELRSATVHGTNIPGGTMFQVMNGGSLTVGNDVTLFGDPRADYVICSSGNVTISAGASVSGTILLENRTCPLVLNGSSANTYRIAAGGDYTVGDLIVKNGTEPAVELVRGSFAMRPVGNDSYLFAPPTVYLNGADGDDGNDGITPETAVRTLQAAIAAAQREKTCNIDVLGGPAAVKDSTEVFPADMTIGQYATYAGDVLRIENSTFTVNGRICGPVALDMGTELTLVGENAAIENNIRIQDSSMIMEEGYVWGNIMLSGGNALLTQKDGTIAGNVSGEADSGSFTQSGGSQKGNVTVSKGDFQWIQTGGELQGTVTVNNGQAVKTGGTVIGKVNIQTGKFAMSGGTVTRTGVALNGTGLASFDFDGGMLDECEVAINAGHGTVTVNGGTITDSLRNAVVLGANATMDIKKGSITGGSADRSVDVAGKLSISGDVIIEDVIYLESSTNPLTLTSAVSGDQVYRLDFAGAYAPIGETRTAVVGAGASATLEHFSLRNNASHLLSLQENGDNLDIRVRGDSQAIYLNGVSGQDSNSGLSAAEAVLTLERAKELLLEQKEQGNEYDIYLCGVVTVVGTETWSLKECDWHPVILRNAGYTGVMVSVRGTLVLEDITLDGNERMAGNSGSVLVVQSGGAAEIKEGTVICNNSTTGSGGGISNAGTLTVRGGNIQYNSARGSGGGIVNSGTLTTKGGMIQHNSAGSWGGGIDNSGATLCFDGGTIQYNKTGSIGGGIFTQNPDSKILSGTIQYNESQSDGGGIYSGTIQIDGGLIQYNRSHADGGGIDTGHLIMNGGIIRGNECAGYGGGVNSYNTVINGGVIEQNKAKYGGGLYIQGSGLECTIAKVTIANNEAVDGGGIYTTDTMFVLQEGELLGNSATGKGGAIYFCRTASGANRTIRLEGGRIADNVGRYGSGITYDAINVADAKMILGNTQMEQTIRLGRNSSGGIAPIKLMSAPPDPSSKFLIEVDAAYAKAGTPVVIADGTNVTDASQYLRNFAIGDSSGYTLVRKGRDIVLGRAYFVDGVNGSDSNDGRKPDSAYRTVTHALEALGQETGMIYICGTVTVDTAENWTLLDGQSISRYNGETVNGIKADSFTGDMIVVEDGADLELNKAIIYGGVTGEEAEDNGYLLVQGGNLSMSADSVLEEGTVYLKDERVIDIKGSGTALLAEVEKENPAQGDIIGQYESESYANPDNFTVSRRTIGFGLAKDGDTVILDQGGSVYVDGIHGKDTNAGTSPEEPLMTMGRAYELLKYKGGTIYIVDTVTVTGNTELTGKRFSQSVGAASWTTAGSISVVRYEKNQNPLFIVASGIFTVSGLLIDGGGTEAAEHASPLIRVNQGAKLQLEGNAVLRENHSAGEGGAVRNEGTVTLASCLITGNSAEKGSAIYQAGTLNIDSARTDLEQQEIYFAKNAYMNILKPPAADTVFYLNMDPSDTEVGRIVAVFSDNAYKAGEVEAQAVHFSIDPRATRKSLAAQGEDTLILAEEFDVTLTGEEFFEKTGDSVLVNAVMHNAIPSSVDVTVKNGDQEIKCSVRNYNRYKTLMIPVSEESIGTLTLNFRTGNTTVEKEIIVSGYQILYAKGQDSLVAKAAELAETGPHTDTAYIELYNGARESRSFGSGEYAIGYADGSAVEIDNSKVSRNMEDAMRYYGLDVDLVTDVPAESTVSVPVIFSNGDRLTEEKEGTITLEGAVYGGAIWKNIELDFRTETVSKVQVCVNLDDEICYDARVVLRQEGTGKVIELERVSQEAAADEAGLFQRIMTKIGVAEKADEWPYQKTAVEDGIYKLYVNDRDTNQVITVSSGEVTQNTVNLYTVTYELNGGHFETERVEQDIYIEGVGLDSLPAPTRSAAVFAGWYDNENLSGESIGKISAQEGRSYRLYAAWSIDTVTDVRLAREEYFEPLNSKLTIEAEIEGISPACVAVQVSRENEKGETVDIPAECIDSGNYKLITVPVDLETIGEIILTFEDERDIVEDPESFVRRIELSAYEVNYAEDRDYLEAAPQEDGNDDVHTDQAEIRIYNGAKEDRIFTPGSWTVSYAQEPDTKVEILNRMVRKDMPAQDAMRYFGMDLLPGDGIEVLAGEVSTVQAVFYNGDLLTENKTGTILLEGAKLGNVAADIPMAFQTKAITRVQVSLQLDEVFANGKTVELRDNAGNTLPLFNTQSGEGIQSHRLFNTLTGEENRNWNYQLTGLKTGSYDILVDQVNTGKKVLAEEGEVSRQKIQLYSLTYELNGGTLSANAPAYYIEGVGVSLVAPYKQDVAFLGWYVSGIYGEEALEVINESASGALKLYAKWDDQMPVLVQAVHNVINYVAGGTAPKTSDRNIVFVDIAFVGGIACLSKMFLQNQEDSGMDEEEKERLVRSIIDGARGKGLLACMGAVGLVFAVLLFYYTLGMKDEIRRLKRTV